jgi:glyoxylase-like metal-dependent hydrolase (beta-lactamase superfamily II)
MAETVIDYQDTAVEVHRVVVGPVENNVYIVRCRETGDSLLIDAANEHDLLLELCRDLNVGQVVETHGHWDHIQAVEAVRDAGINVAVTLADAAMLPSYDQILEDESVVEVGRLKVATIATPGHTPGSMCFAVEGTPLLFSGDTLFPGGPGNTSFEDADFGTIIRSIERRLFGAFGADTIVLPGHGAGTTIGNESPHLDEWVARGW